MHCTGPCLPVISELALKRKVGQKERNKLPTKMSRQVFLALVNPKSGGQMGSNLLERFREILDEERVHDLSDGGPEKALRAHAGRDNLRIIGERFIHFVCLTFFFLTAAHISHANDDVRVTNQ